MDQIMIIITDDVTRNANRKKTKNKPRCAKLKYDLN